MTLEPPRPPKRKPPAKPDAPQNPWELCYFVLNSRSISIRAFCFITVPLALVLAAVVLVAVFAGPAVALPLAAGLGATSAWCARVAKKRREAPAAPDDGQP